MLNNFKMVGNFKRKVYLCRCQEGGQVKDSNLKYNKDNN